MNKLVILLQIILISSISFGQTIQMSKDSLFYLSENNPNLNEIYDSLSIYNRSDISLEIDSIFSKNALYYNVIFKHNDVIEKMDYIWNSSLYPIVVPANDSGKFIFEYGLPVTKISYNFNLLTDSLFILNNSVNLPVLTLSVFSDIPLSIDGNTKTSIDYSLSQNYPNPFNPTTTISFTIPQQEHVKILIYNAIGEEVAILLNQTFERGTHKATWDATFLSSGLYFYKISAGNFVKAIKMILLK